MRLVLNTHADTDHHGGNVTSRGRGARIGAHRLDQPLIEDAAVWMRDRYNQFADDHGIAYAEGVHAWLRGNLGPDTPAASFTEERHGVGAHRIGKKDHVPHRLAVQADALARAAGQHDMRVAEDGGIGHARCPQ